MAKKGDDAVMRKRSRALRKKSRSLRTKESVSARVASIIASKRRRQSGKRRICEGMCFTLPTPEDPFNDRNDPMAAKKDTSTSTTSDSNNKNKRKREGGASVSPLLNNKCRAQKKDDNNCDKAGQPMASKPAYVHGHSGGRRQLPLRGKCKGGEDGGDPDSCLSKYLILCLKAIQDAWSQDLEAEEHCGWHPPLLACKWGIDLWKSCSSSSGLDILDTSGASASSEQVAWLVSMAADIIARKEKEGLVVSTPFLLFLVPSQEKAIEIRSVCKPLKALGVHTVSLHPGASTDHQIRGLESCEPEFIVSTPERLLDLVTLKALDISGVSLLVLDGLESLIVSGFLDELKSIREHITGDPQTVVFSDKLPSVQLQNILKEPVCRVSLQPPFMRAAI